MVPPKAMSTQAHANTSPCQNKPVSTSFATTGVRTTHALYCTCALKLDGAAELVLQGRRLMSPCAAAVTAWSDFSGHEISGQVDCRVSSEQVLRMKHGMLTLPDFGPFVVVMW